MNKDKLADHNMAGSGSEPEAIYDESRRSSKTWLIIGILIFILAAGGAAYHFNSSSAPSDEEKEEDEANQAQTVTVVTPSFQSVTSSINATGSLAARNEVPIGVTGEGGRVARVYVDAGDWVKAGQTLVSIERSCLLYTSPSPRDRG